MLRGKKSERRVRKFERPQHGSLIPCIGGERIGGSEERDKRYVDESKIGHSDNSERSHVGGIAGEKLVGKWESPDTPYRGNHWTGV